MIDVFDQKAQQSIDAARRAATDPVSDLDEPSKLKLYRDDTLSKPADDLLKF